MADEDQGGYIDDAVGGDPVPQTPEPGNEPVPQQPTTEPQDGEPQQPPAKTPNESKNPLESVFVDESGSFDFSSFAQFSLPDDVLAEPAPAEGSEPAEAGDTPPDDRPEWKREADEEREYVTTLREEALGPLEKVAQLIDGGMSPENALHQVYAERKKLVNDHLEEYKYKRDFERREKGAKAAAETTRSNEVKERAVTNRNEVISKLPGKTDQDKIGLFNHILFSKEIGAVVLNREFEKAHPEADKLPQKEKEALADKFLDEIQSNKGEFRYLWERCMDRAHRVMSKQSTAAARRMGAAQEQEKRFAGKRNPAGPYRRQQTALPAGSGSGWETYFG